jgi:hypothetical protein
MDNNKYDIKDLVVSAIEQKPLEFEQAFDDLIVGRIQDAIHDKKVQIAQQMYDYSDELENDFETEEEYSEEE